jgi:hypothetical protein
VPRTMVGAVPARVRAVTYYGHDASVVMSLNGGAERVTARVAGHMAPREGAETWLAVDGGVIAYPRRPPLIEIGGAVQAPRPERRMAPKSAFIPIVKERRA